MQMCLGRNLQAMSYQRVLLPRVFWERTILYQKGTGQKESRMKKMINIYAFIRVERVNVEEGVVKN
jgi:hypothetical protein